MSCDAVGLPRDSIWATRDPRDAGLTGQPLHAPGASQLALVAVPQAVLRRGHSDGCANAMRLGELATMGCVPGIPEPHTHVAGREKVSLMDAHGTLTDAHGRYLSCPPRQ